MVIVPDDLRNQLRLYDQEHVLAWWDRLDDPQRRGLLAQLQALDLRRLHELYQQRDRALPLPTADRIRPVPVIAGGANETARRWGEAALQRGEVAVLLVAGGQGSRLGSEQPKGMFPVGPVSNKSLFQLHAEQVRAIRRRYGQRVPFLIMTSDATHDATVAFFREHGAFGLPADEVHFFQQGTMPALDRETGRLLLEAPGRLFTSPNGHGGVLTALAENGLLERLSRDGIRQVFYFQVDNPLVQIADPTFLGHHLLAQAEVSCKVVPKLGPTDKLGNLVQVDGRLTIIEYSDLPEELARQTDEAGRLRIWAGNPAIHYFALSFLERITADRQEMPFHIARKKVPYLGPQGVRVVPTEENALKFELFIFDVFPWADRWTVVETTRREEFAPLKNAAGPDSPEAVRQAQSDRAAAWLEQAGVVVPRRPDGSAAVPLEISPLFALDAGEVVERVDRKLRIAGPLLLEAG